MIEHVRAGKVHFIPKEWRKLSDVQERLVIILMRDGPQCVAKRTKRTAEALYRCRLIERVDRSSWGEMKPGTVIRASGYCWELYREYQAGQAVGDEFVAIMRGMRK